MSRSFPGLLRAAAMLIAAAAPSFAVAAFSQLSAGVGEIRSIIPVNSSEAYVGTQGGGVFKTTNASVASPSWTRVGSTDMRYINSMAGNYSQTTGSATVYAATSKGVFKTTNSGTAWTQITVDDTEVVAIDPANANNVIVGIRGMGLLRSTNGGASFGLVGGGVFDSVDPTAIAYSPISSAIVYAGFYSNATGAWGGVYRSADGGATWTNWNTVGGALSNKWIKTLAVDNAGIVYAGTFDVSTFLSGVYSQNGTAGGAWSGHMATGGNNGVPCGACPYDRSGIAALHHDRAVPGRMWAGSGPTGYALWRKDAGLWVYAYQDQAQFSRVNAVATFPDRPNVIWWSVYGIGLMQSTNGAGVFTIGPPSPINSGLAADRVNDLAMTGSTFYSAVTGAGVQRSTNSGTNWSILIAGFENPISGAGYERLIGTTHVAINPANTAEVLTATTGSGLFSLSGGTTWVAVPETPGTFPNNGAGFYLRARSLVFQPDGNALFHGWFEAPGSAGGLYRRAGGAWTKPLAGFWPGGSGIGKVLALGGTTYLALMAETFPYRSTNGVNWTALSGIAHIGGSRLYFYEAAQNTASPNIIVAATNKGLYRSSDTGVNFGYVNVTGGLAQVLFSALGFSSNGTLFAGTHDGKVYCSTNSGSTWSNQVLSFDTPVTGIRFQATTLYVLTDGRGIWREPAPTCP